MQWCNRARPRSRTIAAQRADAAQAAAQHARAEQTAVDATGQPALAPAVAAALRRLFEAADKTGLELDRGGIGWPK
jgi:hypothetical protein